MRRTLAGAGFRTRCAVAISIWFILSAGFVAVAYMRGGAGGAWNRFHELVFCGIVLAFLGPALVLGQGLERRLRPRFPVGAPFMAIAATLVPSTVLGIGMAILALRGLKQPG